MSVRDGLLAVLTLGPAYGLQLHAELTSRAPHRRPVNVGQIYGTLDRLIKQTLVETGGRTADALPLYRLTENGRVKAVRWMTEPAADALPDWAEMLDQVVLSSSINPVAARTLVRDYRRLWEAELAGIAAGENALPRDGAAFGVRLARAARGAQAVAAVTWLDEAVVELATSDPFRPLSAARPKRGRRSGV
jgi:DNA-binding PadR family transcriptional regulator